MNFIKRMLNNEMRYLLLNELIEDSEDVENGEYLILKILDVERGIEEN